MTHAPLITSPQTDSTVTHSKPWTAVFLFPVKRSCFSALHLIKVFVCSSDPSPPQGYERQTSVNCMKLSWSAIFLQNARLTFALVYPTAATVHECVHYAHKSHKQHVAADLHVNALPSVIFPSRSRRLLLFFFSVFIGGSQTSFKGAHRRLLNRKRVYSCR